MKRLAILLLALLLSGCGANAEKGAAAPTEEPLSGEELAADAAALYAAITEDLTFSLTVEEADGTVTALDITPENAWNVKGWENLFSSYYQWAPAGAADWEAQLTAESGYLLTMADKGLVLQCRSDGDVVRWERDGAAAYALAVNPKEGREPFEEKFAGILRQIAEDALWRQAFSPVVEDNGEMEGEQIAAQLAEQMAQSVRDAPDWVTWKPLDFQVSAVNLYDAYYGEPKQFCCGIGFRLKLEDPGSSVWNAAAGLDEPDAEGWYDWGGEGMIRKNEAGDWFCDGPASGGCVVDLPFGSVDEAALPELVDAFFLTEGITHESILPAYIVDHPMESLTPLMEGRTEAEKQELLRVLLAELELRAKQAQPRPDGWTADGLRTLLGA